MCSIIITQTQHPSNIHGKRKLELDNPASTSGGGCKRQKGISGGGIEVQKPEDK